MNLEELIQAAGDDVVTKNRCRNKIDPALEVCWATGGSSGGDCWGAEAEEWTEDEVPELESLDTLLNRVCPSITFLQYKMLMRELRFTYEDYSVPEYYGNGTDYRYKRLDLSHLLEEMIKLGLVTGDSNASSADCRTAGERQEPVGR